MGDTWNPWRQEDEAAELAAARAVLEQWDESGGATAEEIEAWLAAHDEFWKAQYQRRDAERQRRRHQFDPERQANRLSLLEVESKLLATQLRPDHHDPDRRSTRARRWSAPDEEEHRLRRLTTRALELRELVGDPETVVDQHGWLPMERRELALGDFQTRRALAVKELRVETRQLEELCQAAPKAERRELRTKTQLAGGRLRFWLDVPRPAVEEMCSECPSPAAWHTWSCRGIEVFFYGPCPAYPQYAARMKEAREMLLRAAAERRPPVPADPQPKRRQDRRTKAQLLEEIDRLQAQIHELTGPDRQPDD